MTIRASVGKGGVNLADDVRRIQDGLNLARRPEHLGNIAVDGIVGPQTIHAISTFQRSHTRIVDGRIDPHGPTLRALEGLILFEVESAVRGKLVQILGQLERALEARRTGMPPELKQLSVSVRMLRGGLPQTPDVRVVLEYTERKHPPIRQIAAVAAAPAAAAAAAAEVAMLLLMAMILMLIVIQQAPAMGRSLEDLVRRIQILMATVLENVKDAIEGIEDFVRRNARAGMLCSSVLMHFRLISNQLLDLLTKRRATDELGRRRFEKQLADLFEKWQQALDAVIACMAANGAT